MDKQAVIKEAKYPPFKDFSEEMDFKIRHILAEFSTVTAMSQDDAVERLERLFDKPKREFPADDIRGMLVEKVSKVLKDYNISHMDMCILRSVLMTQLKWIWKGTYDPAGDYPVFDKGDRPALTKDKRYRISGGGIDSIEFVAGDDIELIQIGADKPRGGCPRCGGKGSYPAELPG